MFSDWLIAKHGSIGRALDAWDGETADGDDPAKGHLALFEAAHMTSRVLDRASNDKRRRVGDQVQFLAELQRSFYAEASRYIKEDLDFGGLVSVSNWTVADTRLLSAIERWTCTAGDIMDRHGYFEPTHDGDASAWDVRAGQTFESRAGVRNPRGVPLQFTQIQAYPQIISELGWPNPNRLRADAAFLCSAYGALQGVDGLFFFSLESNFIQDMRTFKFSVSSPVISGAFPAAALQYRRGDVSAAEPVVIQSLDLNDLFAMKGSPIASEDALDRFRGGDVPPGQPTNAPPEDFDPLTFYVGPIAVNFDARASRSIQRNVRSLIDPKKKTIRSLGGQLVWNYGAGLATVNTPRSQGAAGFLADAGDIALGDVGIRCGNEFAAIVVISLDDLPLRESKRILVQAITEEKAFGFKTEAGKIMDVGSYPFGMRAVDATITLHAGPPVQVQTLDLNGYIQSTHRQDSPDIRLATNAIHTLITR